MCGTEQSQVRNRQARRGRGQKQKLKLRTRKEHPQLEDLQGLAKANQMMLYSGRQVGFTGSVSLPFRPKI